MTDRRKGRATLSDVFSVSRDPQLSPEEKTLWTLYRSYDFGDGAWPGDDTLADHMNKSVRSVKTYKARLRELGYLTVEFRGPKPAVHRAVYPPKAMQPAAQQEGESDAAACMASDAADCTPEPEAMQEGVQEAMQEGVQPAAHPPGPPYKDEYGNTGIRDTPPEGDAVASEPESEAVESEATTATDTMAANELVGAWISLRGERPPDAVVKKQGAAAKRMVAKYTRAEIERALDGIGRLFPHSDGQPWDLMTLDKKFGLALDAPAAGNGRAGRPIEYDPTDTWEDA